MSKFTDRIIVVGAGLAGSGVAGLLAQLTQKKVVILERSLPTAITHPSEKSRAISISYASQKMLSTVGWWDGIAPYATPIESVEVSQAGHLGSVKFEAQALNVSNLGYSVPYDYLHQALYEATSSNEHVCFEQSDRIIQIQSEQTGVSIAYQKGAEECTLDGRLLIAADGTHSDCRTQLGIACKGENNGDIAVVGELTLATAHHNQAFQRFTKEGILAVLPLTNRKQVKFVLSLSKAQSEVVATWGKLQWLAFMQRSFKGRLIITAVTKGGQFPIQTQLATQCTHPSVVLFGNAAHTIFPLAAQGFNLTMRDGAALTQLLCSAIQSDPNNYVSSGVLNEYATWRAKEAAQLARFTQGLEGVFSNPFKMVAHSRGLGLLSLDACSAMKTTLGRWLLGLGGRVPELALGRLPTIRNEVKHDV